MQHNYTHIILTQFAHNFHTILHTERTHTTQNTEQNTDTRYNNMNTEYKIQDNTTQDTDTETNTYTSTENSAHNYRTYSLDYYNEFAYIKNSNTIELYTILQDKI